MADPLGKRALYSVPDTGSGAVAVTAPARRRAAPMGKEALFSTPEGERRFGTVVVECSHCGSRSRVGWGEFAWRHLPVGLWFPWLRYSRYMSCPACERRTWLGVSWFA